MKLTVERELRVENAFSGQIISVKTGEVTQENSELDPWLARTYARMYGYVLTKGEEGILISFDFGFEEYVEHHFLVDERVDYRLAGALAATRNAASAFNECIDDIYTYG